VSIYAYNTVDTNCIIYSTQATTVPTPIEITSLEWDNTHATQSIMKWNYASDIFAAIDFLLVIMDVTTGVFSSVFVPAHNAIQGAQQRRKLQLHVWSESFECRDIDTW